MLTASTRKRLLPPGGPLLAALLDVQEDRHISASDATTRYGTGHTGGAIEIRIRS